MTSQDQLPRVFVGTMYTQEGDFEKCIEHVRKQEGVTVTHSIISNLKEKDAHNALWSAWRAASDDHDCFVKVDADTILIDTTTLASIVRVFEEIPEATGLQAPLHDYMTDDSINGLNAFTKKVKFIDTQDELYCDRVDRNNDCVIRAGRLPASLIPAGLHCHHTTERQAFHYGVHRMLKGQTGTLERVFKAWSRDRDRCRLFALMGGHMSQRFSENRKFNYADEEFEEAFTEACDRYDELQPHYVKLITP